MLVLFPVIGNVLTAHPFHLLSSRLVVVPKRIVSCPALLAVVFFWLLTVTRFCVAASPVPGDGSVPLTSSEVAWIRGHPIVTVAPTPDFPPIEFFDRDGRFAGITADYLTLLGRKLGVTLTVRHLASWQEVMESTERGEVDLWGAATETASRARLMRFTKPYLSFPAVIIVRKGTYDNLTLDKLTGLKVVSLARHVTDDYLSQQYPTLNRIIVHDIPTGLKMVSLGAADAIVVNAAPASYYIGETGLTNLVIAGQSGVVWPFSFASRKDWPELNGILQKALDSVTPAERQAIIDKWVKLDAGGLVSRRTFGLTVLISLGTAALVIGLVLAANRSLRRVVHQHTTELRAELKERQRAEIAAEKSEERLRLFFEAAFEGLFFHKQGVVSDMNPATTEILGYTPAEAIGRHLSEFISPRSRSLVLKRMQAGEPGPYELVGVRRDGSEVPLEVRIRTIGTDGEPQRVVGFRDITERKQAEEALREAHDMLEKKVAARTRELAEANARLQELDHLKSMFLASMSHELRTPLNSIIGFTGILLQGMVGPLNDEQQKQLTMVKSSANHLLALINDVLDMSKIEAGELKVTCAPFNLRGSIEKVVQTISPLAEKKGLSLAKTIAPEIGTLVGDERRVEQILLNLLGNAIKFTETGQISVDCAVVAGQVRLSVTDTGIGIKEAEVKNIFKPFQQIDSGITRKYEGTGLGLSICRKLLELMGGEIWVESEWGKGSTFRFSLPINRSLS